jgi:uncharacterized protein (TIGR00730 family)
MQEFRSVCVFCGSNVGSRPEYSAAAEEIGRLLAGRGIALVYGGGKVGLMGKIADTVLRAGGSVTGVIPQALMLKEIGHEGLTELKIVNSMHDRKALMAELSDGFIALPGGFGTLDEFCEILTWAQLGLHHKPCGLLNVNGYYDHFSRFLDHAVDEQFLRPLHRAMVICDDDPEGLLGRMRQYEAPLTGKWIDRSET